jgi:hypothetical protein
MSTNLTPKRCGLATASLVLGIVGVLLGFIVMVLLIAIPGIVDDLARASLAPGLIGVLLGFSIGGILCAVTAIIVGRKARIKIQQSSGSLAGMEHAFGGLTMGYAGLGLSFMMFLVMLETIPSALKPPTNGTLSNGRQIFIAMLARNVKSGAIDKESEWPQSSAYSTSAAVFTNLVESGALKVDYSFFGAPGLTAYKGTNAEMFKAENNAWCVVADVKGSDPDQMPVLFTSNLKINSLAEFRGPEQLSDDPPFGRKCLLVIFKGGAGQRFTPEMLLSNFNIGHATNRVLRP